MKYEVECAGKHKYASKSLVDMIVGYKQGAKLESYKCPHCDFYHVREAKEPVRELKKAPK